MIMRTRFILAALVLVAFAISGCATQSVQQYDYTAYRANPPRSILVLPPLNETVEVNAPYSYLSTISRPLGEAGYYVFPVAVIDAFMRENGLPDPAEMQNVPLNKLQKIIGADAVLYTTIDEWGQKYQVLQSVTTVKARAKLVDARTGATLWEGTAAASQNSGAGGSDIITMLVVAVVDQIVNTTVDKTHNLAATANYNMVNNRNIGLPLGPYNPDHVTDPRRQ